MKVTQEEALDAVREVFAGRITRDMVIDLPPRTQVYVALAIMLALPQHYLKDGVVIGHFKTALDGLLSLGNPRRFDSGIWLGNYVTVCRAAGLYKPSPGRGGLKPTTLTPPVELTALVRELGVTPAILTFREESLAGIAANEEYWENVQTLEAGGTEQAATAEAVVERLVAELDRGLLREVYHELGRELGLS